MLFADLLSLHSVTFLMIFILVYLSIFTSMDVNVIIHDAQCSTIGDPSVRILCLTRFVKRDHIPHLEMHGTIRECNLD